MKKKEIRKKIRERLKILDELKKGINKTPMQKLKLLFGVKE